MTSVTSIQTPLSTKNGMSDVRAFRKCLGQYGTGVAIVAAELNEQRCGMTINSFSALSLSPPWVMWSIRNESSARSFFETVKHFSINILAADQVDISGRFAQSGGDPFVLGGWQVGHYGEPLLEGSVACLSCSAVQVIPGGDHTIIIGQVMSYEHTDRTPLLFLKGEYCVSTPLSMSQTAEKFSLSRTQKPEPSLMRMLSTVAAQWVEEFDIDRASRNLSRVQSRILAWLSEGPHTLEQLKVRVGLTDTDLEEEVEGLVSLRYVNRVDARSFQLTQEGCEKRDNLAIQIQHFENAKLAGFEKSKIEDFKKILHSLLKK